MVRCTQGVVSCAGGDDGGVVSVCGVLHAESWFLGASALLIAAAALVLAGCDWTTFRFDVAHTGYNPFESTLNTGNVATLAEDWIADTGDQVESSPIVAGGVLYEGSDNGKLYAFDASGNTNCTGSAPKTCAPLWTA